MVNVSKKLRLQKIRRAKRTRAKIRLSNRPRVVVFRSNQHLYCQLINSRGGKVFFFASDRDLPGKKQKRHVDLLTAKELGKFFGQKVLEKGIKEVVFDKGPYQYHGRIKALAEGMREVGLKF